MVSSSILLAAGLAVSASAVPTTQMPGHRKSSGFSVPQVRSNTFVRHGPSQMARTMLKYGQTVPDELLATIKSWKIARRQQMLKRTNGSAITTPEDTDVEYLTPVEIGTPPQTLNLDFDSGSSDLWVFSSETPSSSVNGQATYDASKSSTSKEITGATWDISYGDGSSSSGNVYTDVVSVGGVSFDTQAVEAAKKVSTSFTSDANNDGLLGLAFSTLNTVTPTAQKTFFDNIKADLDQSLWTADLKAGKPGTYNFGWIDDSLYTGSIAYTDVDSSDGFWKFTPTSYSIGGASGSNGTGSGSGATPSSSAAPVPTSTGANGHHHHSGGGSPSSDSTDPGSFLSDLFGGKRSPGPKKSHPGRQASASLTGIADTGTTLALLDSAICEEYYGQVSGAKLDSSAGGYVFACSATLPSFSYTVGDVTITIPGDYLNYSPVDASGTQCFGGIQPDTSIGFSIWGDVALKAAFVVFKDDGSAPQLGFAQKQL